jgi:UDP-N-acetylglucosamine 2-epimerase (non-hydrolysing)
MRPLIHLVAGARPNFMKVAPLYHELLWRGETDPRIVHTGQHYDEAMSDGFFRDLRMPSPHHHLGVGGGSHAEQTGRIMLAYENLCFDSRPDWTIVVGDVNSTLACAITAKKLCIPLAHLEAGLRSFDRAMPEEINRVATDAIADLLWTPSPDADVNLRNEGISESRIKMVGNIMIDAYVMLQDTIDALVVYREFGVKAGEYGVVTLHRPANVDSLASLAVLVNELEKVAKRLPLIFPVHPRTRARLEAAGFWPRLLASGLHVCEPVGYIDFMNLVSNAKLVVTDSGGVQEETTYLGIPCLTVRDTTERPITLTEGTNRLIAPGDIATSVAGAMSGAFARGKRPALWDGRTAARVADSLAEVVAK